MDTEKDWGRAIRDALFVQSAGHRSDGEVVTALRKLIEENSLQDMRNFLSALLHENITVSRHEMEDTNELPEDSEIDYDDDGCASEELQSRLAVEPLGQKLDDGKRDLRSGISQGIRAGAKRRRTAIATSITRKIGFLKSSRNTFKVNVRKVNRHKVQASRQDVPIDLNGMEKMKAYFQNLDQEETLKCVVSSPNSQRIDGLQEKEGVVLTEEEERVCRKEYKQYCRGLNGIVKPVPFKEFIHQRNVYDMMKR